MSDRDLSRALKEADELLGAQGVPGEVERRLRAKLEERRSRRPLVAWSIGLAAAAAALTLWWLRPSEPESLGGFAVLAPSSDLRGTQNPDGSVTIAAGTCTLKDRALGAELAVEEPSALTRTWHGLHLIRGALRIEVDPEFARPQPFEVEVSGGRILVLGTRFTVRERGAEGEVELTKGKLRFETADGRQAELEAGQALRWPLPAPTPTPSPSPTSLPKTSTPTAERGPRRPRPSPSATVTAPPPAEQRSLDTLLGRLAGLRTRGRYPEAAAELRRALEGSWSAGTRERLSFELGQILSDHLRDQAAACQHWAQHLGRFGAGRYGTEIDFAKRQLGCDDSRPKGP